MYLTLQGTSGIINKYSWKLVDTIKKLRGMQGGEGGEGDDSTVEFYGLIIEPKKMRAPLWNKCSSRVTPENEHLFHSADFHLFC